MKLFLSLGLMLFVCFFVSSSLYTKKKWTILVYMAADNNLKNFTFENIEQMKRVGTTDEITVLVYVCTQHQGERKIARRLIIFNDAALELDYEYDKDSGNSATLMEACRWAHQDFPAEHFCLIIWNHGSGPLNRGICYDDTTGNYLSDKDFCGVLENVCDEYRLGKRIDIVAFDACVMSSVEYACTLKPFVRYMVASEQAIYAKGFDYEYILKVIAHNPSMSPHEYAQAMVKGFANYWRLRTTNYTLTALDLGNNLDYFASLIDKIAIMLRVCLQLQKNKSVILLLNHVRNKTTYFTDVFYRDLLQFYQYLYLYIDQISLVDEAQEVEIKKTLRLLISKAQEVLRYCVVEHVAGRRLSGSTGLFIYFPDIQMHRSYPQLLWCDAHPHWHAFLKDYAEANKGLNEGQDLYSGDIVPYHLRDHIPQ